MFANFSTLLTERGLIKEAWPNSEMIRILPETKDKIALAGHSNNTNNNKNQK